MTKRLDLVGKTFGRLKVVSFDGISKQATMWRCICDCGNKIIVGGNSLTTGNTMSCGCYNKDRLRENKTLDLEGKTFGRLTVLSFSGYLKNRKSYWYCSCSCGNNVTVIGSGLISGNTTSCGCYHKEMIRDTRSLRLEGKRFGYLKVISLSEIKNNNTYWKCICDCGATSNVLGGNLTSGNTTSCGCRVESSIATASKLYCTDTYEALTEYKTVYCKDTRQWYKCDIFIPKYNAYIEVHGDQHYKLSSWHVLQANKNGTTPEQEFQNQKNRDKVKKAYAKRHGIYIEVNLMKIKSAEEAIAYIEARLPN